jgi:hypothetical protein
MKVTIINVLPGKTTFLLERKPEPYFFESLEKINLISISLLSQFRIRQHPPF